MKLQFDSKQDYQHQAIKAVVDVFEGQPLAKGEFEAVFAEAGGSIAFTNKGVGNNLVLTDEQLLKNIQAVQEQNGIKQSDSLGVVRTTEGETLTALNLTVEMETGTGKTYTYIRTIYELNQQYGFKKFVIVVPSVAIREGALKNLEITHEHFQALYGNPPINFIMYDSGKLTALRNFASSNAIQVLVINIDSFTKDSNIINTVRETGVKPIEFIQATQPIVIVDEPQNMETDVRKNAIHNLNPLCTLRYSATHRNFYNLIYSLNPVQAYDLGLVKQIEVDGITIDRNISAASVFLKKIKVAKNSLKALINTYVHSKNGIVKRDLTIELGDDLYLVSGSRDIYKNGYILSSINAKEKQIEFSNGIVIKEGEIDESYKGVTVKYLMERTIYHHFEKEYRYWKKGKYDQIKVLSLFFIDKVSNYRKYDDEGNIVKGDYAIWFEEIFKKYAQIYRTKYADLFTTEPSVDYFAPSKVHETDIPQLHPEYFEVSKVHNGYFSQDRKGAYKDTNGNTRADDDTYTLIMKDKERLLDLDEPLRFIFSHSALREGWDNPNVFQICTLNESKSDIRKRQEIGRGLRLPVNNKGVRIQDKRVNVLTVVANETYQDFSEALQREIQEETGVQFTGRIMDAREKKAVKLTKELTPENCPLFFEIWDRIKHRTRYQVNYDTNELIGESIAELSDFYKMPLTKRPMLEARTARLKISNEGIEGELVDLAMKQTEAIRYLIPDVYGYIQSRVDITRTTIYEILSQSNRLNELEINPQLFLDNVVGVSRRVLSGLMVDGIKYEKINGSTY